VILLFNLDFIKNMSTEEKYKYMLLMIDGQLDSEKDDLANISNVTAIIKAMMDNCNWVGFYFMRDGELILGPFQGLPACNRIKVGRGVCGTAVEKRKIQRVADVHAFPGHIACDSASNSEIVLPIIKNDEVYGVLDIDSPSHDRFSELEEKYLIKAMDKLNKHINWENI
jgi:L-methionine (R)-S-oxide reductase